MDLQSKVPPRPKGPRGEKRPADAIGRAIKVARIATGEVEDEREELSSAAARLGSKGGKARARNLTASERSRIAKKAANQRWRKGHPEPENAE